jgi:hypothetical protein
MVIGSRSAEETVERRVLATRAAKASDRAHMSILFGYTLAMRRIAKLLVGSSIEGQRGQEENGQERRERISPSLKHDLAR